MNEQEERELAIYRASMRRIDLRSHQLASRPSVTALVLSLNKALEASVTHDERIAIWIGLCRYNPTFFDTTKLFTKGGAWTTIQWLYYGLDGKEHQDDITHLPVREVVVSILKQIAMQTLGYIPTGDVKVDSEVVLT